MNIPAQRQASNKSRAREQAFKGSEDTFNIQNLQRVIEQKNIQIHHLETELTRTSTLLIQSQQKLSYFEKQDTRVPGNIACQNC